MRTSRLFSLFLVFALIIGACGDDDGGGVFEEATTSAPSAASGGSDAGFDPATFWAQVDAMYAEPIAFSIETATAEDPAGFDAGTAMRLVTDAYVNAVMRTFMVEVVGSDVDDETWVTLVDEAIAAWDRFGAVRADATLVLDAWPSVSGLRSLRSAQVQLPGGQCRILRPGEGIENEIAVLTATERAEQLGASRKCLEDWVADNIRATQGKSDREAIRIIKEQYDLTDDQKARDILQERKARKEAQDIIKKVGETALAVGISGITGGIGPVTYIMVGDTVTSIAFSTVDHPGRHVVDAIGAFDKVVSWKGTGAEGAVHYVIDLAAEGTKLDGEAALEITVDQDKGSVSIRPADPPPNPDLYRIDTTQGGNVDLVGACPQRAVDMWRQVPCPAEQLILETEGRLAPGYPLEDFLLPDVADFAGTYTGEMPVIAYGYGEIGSYPVVLLIAEDGGFVADVSGTVEATIEFVAITAVTDGFCEGTVEADGSMECSGSGSTSLTANGVAVGSASGPISGSGQLADGVIDAVFVGTDGTPLNFTLFREE